jgi:uncharacterized protein
MLLLPLIMSGRTVVIAVDGFPRLREARSLWQRLRGLMFERDRSRCFLLLRNCRSIHTCFLMVEIDVLFLDDTMKVKQVKDRVKPWRVVLGPRAATITVEMPAGFAGEQRIGEGDTLQWS